MRKLSSILLLMTVMMTGSCSMEDPVVPSVDSNPIEFTSSKTRIITKAGDETQNFEDGTKFKLFAVQASSGAHNWANTVLYDREGIETSGTVSYGAKVSYGVDPLNVLDFYGVTYDTTEDVTVNGSTGGVPKVEVSGSSLPDLMYSDNLKSKTSSSGLLNMEFRHTMSKMNFEILKQDESEDSEKKLENAVLKKVVLYGTGVSGTFNVETGQWESPAVSERVIYDATDSVDPFKITTSGQTFASLLSIPVKDGDISLRIYLGGIEDGKEYIDYTLTIAEGQNLRLEQNHEYTLSIVVLKNDVRIVTVTPKVYDWIDVDLGDVAYFGQPVYFGGLMWMDRNLGATSADCENDWYNSVGHYYQFGRNIPFILDIDKWLAYTEDDGVKDMQKARIIVENTDNIKTLHSDWDNYDVEKKNDILKLMVECVYSLDHKGERVHGYKKVSSTDDNLIRKVGDVILDQDGNIDNESTSAAYRYGGNIQTWTLRDNRAAYYWSNVEDQPCPKGWRVPTRDDLYSFMPRGQQVNWNTYKYPKKFETSVSTYNEGRYGYIEGDQGRYNVCYMIKNPGTDKAYRIRIKSHFAKNIDGNGYSQNKRYISITRFSATKEDKIEDYVSSSYADAILPDSKENTLWNNPIETAEFPGCGYFVPDKDYPDLRSFGWGTIMRTSDPKGFDTGNIDNNSNWVQYLSVTDFQLSIQNGSRRVLGDQIRCVRDVNAK